MLPIASQTAGPIEIFGDTQGLPGGVLGLKKIKIFFSTGNAGPFS